MFIFYTLLPNVSLKRVIVIITHHQSRPTSFMASSREAIALVFTLKSLPREAHGMQSAVVLSSICNFDKLRPYRSIVLLEKLLKSLFLETPTSASIMPEKHSQISDEMHCPRHNTATLPLRRNVSRHPETGSKT